MGCYSAAHRNQPAAKTDIKLSPGGYWSGMGICLDTNSHRLGKAVQMRVPDGEQSVSVRNGLKRLQRVPGAGYFRVWLALRTSAERFRLSPPSDERVVAV
jgi:hypothetical protein